MIIMVKTIRNSLEFLGFELGLQIGCDCPFTVMMKISFWFKFSARNNLNAMI